MENLFYLYCSVSDCSNYLILSNEFKNLIIKRMFGIYYEMKKT